MNYFPGTSPSISKFLITTAILLIFSASFQVAAIGTSDSTHAENSSTITVKIFGDGCYCQSTKWYSIFIFFVFNYGAHALTVRVHPGQSTLRSSLFAICFPYWSMGAALMTISASPIYKFCSEDPLQKARRAGALCKIVQSAPRDRSKELLTTLWLPNPEGVVGQMKNVTLPLGYEFQSLGIHDRVKPRNPASLSVPPTRMSFVSHEFPASRSTLPRSNVDSTLLKLPEFIIGPKATISVLQACYAIFTFVRASARCGHLSQFGYVSPAFTVLPYATMSLVNALSVITTPVYPQRYLVASKDLDDLIKVGWAFDLHAIVGELIEEEVEAVGDNSPGPSYYLRNFSSLLVVMPLAIICIGLPYVAMTLLTRFETGRSTQLQRGVILSWLAFGQLLSVLHLIVSVYQGQLWAPLVRIEKNLEAVLLWRGVSSWICKLCAFLFCLVLASPALWSFEILGQMLREMGECMPLNT